MNFRDKVVLVTGASSGIGAAVAKQFATEGACISIVARKLHKLTHVSEECERRGSKPLVVVADLTKDEDVKRAVLTTVQHFRRLDILVNSAGIIGASNILDQDAMKTFDRVMNINLRATVHVTNVAAPYIVMTKGNIINICSVGATSIMRSAGTFSVCSSKAALDHFTRCIASELAPKGVRVNAVSPGAVRTDIIENMGVRNEEFINALWNKVKTVTALNRVSEPEEIANIVLFLSSDMAKSITGASILADNGILLKGVITV